MKVQVKQCPCCVYSGPEAEFRRVSQREARNAGYEERGDYFLECPVCGELSGMPALRARTPHGFQEVWLS
jgi:hypothetical protein